MPSETADHHHCPFVACSQGEAAAGIAADAVDAAVDAADADEAAT